jgi:hypothetical protein
MERNLQRHVDCWETFDADDAIIDSLEPDLDHVDAFLTRSQQGEISASPCQSPYDLIAQVCRSLASIDVGDPG